jgi:EAL and modified HD-GYP domain-containing signal transduction protein
VRPRQGQDASSSTSAILRLLALLGDEDSSNAQVVDALRADPGVSYKLLRLVNSSGDDGLEASLEFAVRVMGRVSLHRWLSVLLLRLQEDRSGARDEVILSCLARGRFGELLRKGGASPLTRDLPEAGSCFLLGLFSRLDVLLGRPMEAVLAGLRLHPEVEGALLGGGGAGGVLLEVVEAAEGGDWERLSGLLAANGVDETESGRTWLEATAWALEQVATPH